MNLVLHRTRVPLPLLDNRAALHHCDDTVSSELHVNQVGSDNQDHHNFRNSAGPDGKYRNNFDHQMMDRVSVIEITGSADSAYYSHQSFESELSCDLSEANTDTPTALQGEQGES